MHWDQFVIEIVLKSHWLSRTVVVNEDRSELLQLVHMPSAGEGKTRLCKCKIAFVERIEWPIERPNHCDASRTLLQEQLIGTCQYCCERELIVDAKNAPWRTSRKLRTNWSAVQLDSRANLIPSTRNDLKDAAWSNVAHFRGEHTQCEWFGQLAIFPTRQSLSKNEQTN